jgi:hypothetical protein
MEEVDRILSYIHDTYGETFVFIYRKHRLGYILCVFSQSHLVTLIDFCAIFSQSHLVALIDFV